MRARVEIVIVYMVSAVVAAQRVIYVSVPICSVICARARRCCLYIWRDERIIEIFFRIIMLRGRLIIIRICIYIEVYCYI